jgi:hypothetical protein
MFRAQKRMKNTYNSKSHQLIQHYSSNKILHLPDLWHRTGNSMGVYDRVAAISDTMSYLKKQ